MLPRRKPAVQTRSHQLAGARAISGMGLAPLIGFGLLLAGMTVCLANTASAAQYRMSPDEAAQYRQQLQQDRADTDAARRQGYAGAGAEERSVAREQARMQPRPHKPRPKHTKKPVPSKPVPAPTPAPLR